MSSEHWVNNPLQLYSVVSASKQCGCPEPPCCVMNGTNSFKQIKSLKDLIQSLSKRSILHILLLKKKALHTTESLTRTWSIPHHPMSDGRIASNYWPCVSWQGKESLCVVFKSICSIKAMVVWLAHIMTVDVMMWEERRMKGGKWGEGRENCQIR